MALSISEARAYPSAIPHLLPLTQCPSSLTSSESSKTTRPSPATMPPNSSKSNLAQSRETIPILSCLDGLNVNNGLCLADLEFYSFGVFFAFVLT